ncbi:MAG: hypothetical protein AAGJ46_01560 [Planctomycetota bacterium]
MEAFGIMGFVFGMTSFTFAIIAMSSAAALGKRVDDLDSKLNELTGTPAGE